ncbi:MAG: hypothetical protein EBT13_14635, partial [Rhodobacteraceae bacterium]|nr:hypothetical protein [Paracoccaceae bacterium]
MTNALSSLLATRDWLMADGATGTTLFNMGLTSGDAPEMWNVEHPDRIRTLYQGAVDAGSDIFLTNSFGGNASRLKLHGAEGRVRELNRIAAEIGRDVADKAGRTVVVAGSVGPTGEIMSPMGSLTHERAVENFVSRAIVGMASAYFSITSAPKPSIRNRSSRPLGEGPIAKR